MSNNRSLKFFGLMLFALTLASGCSDSSNGGNDGIREGQTPRIQVSLSGTEIGADTTLSISKNISYFEITNFGGNINLDVKSISIETANSGDIEAVIPELPATVEPTLGALRFELNISDNVSDDALGDVRATVRIKTNQTLHHGSEFVFYLKGDQPTPNIALNPSSLSFDTVSAGETTTKTFQITNTGQGTLNISSFHLSGSPGFKVTFPVVDSFTGGDWDLDATTASSGVTFSSPLTIESGQAITATMWFTASNPNPARADLRLHSNDPGEDPSSGTLLQVYANEEGPCIQLNPPTIDFGGKIVGQPATIPVSIYSCGDRALEVSNLELTDNAGGLFVLDSNSYSLPLAAIEPGEQATFNMIYTPATAAQMNVNTGEITKDRGQLRVTSNAYLSELDVDVIGYGVSDQCPTAAITITEGEEVAPQTRLHLSGSGVAADGSIQSYEWSLVDDHSNNQPFLPSAFVQNPTYTVNVAGEYTFKLKVYDNFGNVSCEDATYTVFVASDEPIHIELLWTNPSAPNEVNGQGSDVDLHVLHPNAYEWFDYGYDCYFGNKLPTWPGASTGDVRLDRDDVDGVGPENFNHDAPEFGAAYRVGVHYYSDHNYGTALATIRFYHYGNLRAEKDRVSLVDGDMWEVGEMAWPSGAVTFYETSYGQPVIIADYDYYY